MDLSCLTLDRVSRPGFSKTARSRPGHGEAVRDGHDGPALPLFARRFADDLLKTPAERAQAGESDVQADLCHVTVRRTQQIHGALDAAALEIAMGRLAEGRAEGPDEVRLRNMRDAGERGNGERLRVGAVHRVTGAQHSAVELLYPPAHPVITPPIGDVVVQSCGQGSQATETLMRPPAASLTARPNRRLPAGLAPSMDTLTEMPRRWAIWISVGRSGFRSPSSRRATAGCFHPNLSASCRWVRWWSARYLTSPSARARPSAVRSHRARNSGSRRCSSSTSSKFGRSLTLTIPPDQGRRSARRVASLRIALWKPTGFQ